MLTADPKPVVLCMPQVKLRVAFAKQALGELSDKVKSASVAELPGAPRGQQNRHSRSVRIGLLSIGLVL